MGSSWRLALHDVARAFAARRRRDEGEGEAAVDEAGFTLIELMVVLLIMGILMAIAIPTFLGAASGAHDKSSQSDVTNALTSAKTLYASNSTYTATATEVTALHGTEPEMTFATGAGTGATDISVDVTTSNNVLVLASWSKSTKNCWLGVDNESTTTTTSTNGKKAPPGISYDVVTGAAAVATCSATTAVTKTWARNWPKA